MLKTPEFVVDHRGNRRKVVLDIREYRKLLEKLEELDDIRAYDRAIASGEKPVPFRPRRNAAKRRGK